MDAERIKIVIMEILQRHRGRANAITRDELRDRLRHWCIEIDDRPLRDIYVHLPICSGPEGLWIPRTAKEVIEFRDYLLAKIPGPKAIERVRRIYAYFPNLIPIIQEQMNLEI